MPVNIDAGILRFRIDVPQLNTAVSSAMKSAQSQMRQVQSQFMADWQKTVAQLRAATASGILNDAQIKQQRQSIVGMLEAQIIPMRVADQLNKSQLSSMKAMTLELERQKSALANKGGVTAGTSGALGQLSFQTVQGVERTLDALVNRYLGGTAGAIARTVRDASYYAGGGATGSGGAVGGLISKLSAFATPANLGIAGGALGLTALAATIGSISKSEMELAQSIQNTAAATGLSNTQVQEYNELAKLMGVNADTLTNAFSRIQVQLGKYAVSGKSADTETQGLVGTMSRMGVSVTDTSGRLKPVNNILGEFYIALGKIPDAETRAAITSDAFGTRGKVITQVFEEARAAGEDYKQMLDSLQSTTLSDNQIQMLLQGKKAWDDLTKSIDTATNQFKAFIAIHPAQTFLSVFPGGITGMIEGFAAQMFVEKYAQPSKPGTLPQGMLDKLPASLAAKMIPGSASDQLFDQNSAALQKQLDVLTQGGAKQAQIAELRKKEEEEIKNNLLAQAVSTERQVKALQVALDLEQHIADLHAKSPFLPYAYSANMKLAPTIGNVPGGAIFPGLRINPSTLNQNLYPLGPTPLPLQQSTAENAAANPLLSLFGTQKNAQDYLDQATQISGELYDITASATQKIEDQYAERYKTFKDFEAQYPAFAQQAEKAIADAQSIETQRIKDQNEQAIREMAATAKQESDELFNALVNGGKNRGKEIAQVFRNIALEPVKTIFENLTKSIFESINNTLGIGKGSAAGGGNAGTGGGPLSGVAGGIFGAIFHGFGGSKGAKTPPILGGTTPAGTVPQVQVPEMYITAATVYLTAGTLLSGSGTSLGIPAGANGFAGFPLGSLGAWSGLGSGLLPTSIGRTSSNSGINLGNLTAIIGTAKGLGTAINAGVSSRSGSGGTTSGIPSSGQNQFQTAINTLASVAIGGSMIAAGRQSGGVGGALSGALGGATAGFGIGSLFGGPGGPGSLIGAGVGALAGGIFDAFGGGATGRQNAYNQQVQNAALAQRITLPPSETFSFAQGGSMGQTFGQTFSSNGNGQFSAVALPSNTPFWQQGILGTPKYANQLSWLNSSISHTQTGLPFFGGGSDIFAGTPTPGQIGVNTGVSMTGATPNVTVNVSGFVDKDAFTSQVAPAITAAVSKGNFNTSSGIGQSNRRSVLNMP